MTYDSLRMSRSHVVRQQLRTVRIIHASQKKIIFGARRARTNCFSCSIKPAYARQFKIFLRTTMQLNAHDPRSKHIKLDTLLTEHGSAKMQKSPRTCQRTCPQLPTRETA